MKVFILGAGKPSVGLAPSLLQLVDYDTTALDWQIANLAPIVGIGEIHVMSGYLSDEVIRKYPNLSFTVLREWEDGAVLSTLLSAPFGDDRFITTYADTIFRREIFERVAACSADVGYCVDSTWKSRYASRTEADIELAETVEISNQAGRAKVAEFCGLVIFGRKVAQYLLTTDALALGSNLVDLISHLKERGFSHQVFDVEGQWAEFNSRDDISQFVLGTKSETLSRLESVVNLSRIGSQLTFTSAYSQVNETEVLIEIGRVFSGKQIIVRSSAASEDTSRFSNAGKFESVADVPANDSIAVATAIRRVAKSYDPDSSHADQILIQEYVASVEFCGVVFTCDLDTGAPYYRIDFDEQPETTATVTGGLNNTRTIFVYRGKTEFLCKKEPKLGPVLEAVQELERLLDHQKLDVEFAVDKQGIVHVFQIRPIAVNHSDFSLDEEMFSLQLKNAAQKFESIQSPTDSLLGERKICANMTDWNPAEIIGVRPRPLAISLYRELVCDDIWAQQRMEYGYRDVRPKGLLLELIGQPFIDVRASLNSFVPAAIPEDAARRIVNAYLQILQLRPELQDKVEFEVAFTSWTPSTAPRALERLSAFGVTSKDIEMLDCELKAITRRAISRLEQDISPILELRDRTKALLQGGLSTIQTICSLVQLCKSFGTLPFAHAARAAFVSTDLLFDFVRLGILSEERRQEFLRSVKTVVSEIDQDKRRCLSGDLTAGELNDKYGHLRPGTYEITSLAYWELPQVYLKADSLAYSGSDDADFYFSEDEASNIASAIASLDPEITFERFEGFLRASLQAREFTKFEFTRALSKVLDLCTKLSGRLGLSREEMSFLEFEHLEELRMAHLGEAQLKQLSVAGNTKYSFDKIAQLPSVLLAPADFYCFERSRSVPNYITLRNVRANVVEVSPESIGEELKGKIVLIPNADPGFDWMFGCGIVGMITQYGGANSHMAIRSAELGIPAAIGVGDSIFERATKSRVIELDCVNRVIRSVA